MLLPSTYTGKIKLFLDGADKAAMMEMAKNLNIRGFTTNPSLMRKSGVRDYRSFCKEMLAAIPDKPISFEVFSDDLTGMKKQGLEINSWGKNVYVKIPVTNSEGVPTAPLIKELAAQGVKLNVTAILTLPQVWETCQALKGGAPSIISVFAGRIADTGRSPLAMMEASRQLCSSTDKNIELLWASTREAYNVVEAEGVGCDIITVPNDILKKVSQFNKDLAQLSLETVRTFKADAESAGFSL